MPKIAGTMKLYNLRNCVIRDKVISVDSVGHDQGPGGRFFRRWYNNCNTFTCRGSFKRWFESQFVIRTPNIPYQHILGSCTCVISVLSRVIRFDRESLAPSQTSRLVMQRSF